MNGTLYVVATPLGNLADLSPRAVETLTKVSTILAEDTRHSQMLLQHYFIKTSVIACHDHNEKGLTEKMMSWLREGKDLALISDAGTPLISDPGFILVRRLREEGFRIIPIPGPCALITALSVSGLPTDSFIFEGFLPAKTIAREQQLRALSTETKTLIFYESVHRIQASLTDMIKVFSGSRRAFLAREMTKTYESYYSGTLESIAQDLASHSDQIRGEFVVIVGGAPQKMDEDLDLRNLEILTILLRELPLKQATQLAAKLTGIKKNKLYEYALAWQEGQKNA